MPRLMHRTHYFTLQMVFSALACVHFMLRTINSTKGIQILKSVYVRQICTVSLMVHSCFCAVANGGKMAPRERVK